MSLADVVTVNVSLQGPGVTEPGFGIPLLLSYTPTWQERTRTYTSIAGVEADFAATTPEFLAAEAAFSQKFQPTAFMIGRGANKPTQVHTITIKTVISTAGFVYKVNVFYLGVLQSASFTTVGSDTNDTIVAGLVSAINALAAPALASTATATGTIGSHIVTITANTPASNTWIAVEPLASSVTSTGTGVADTMEVAQTTADPGVLTDLDNIFQESDLWYGLLLLFKSSATVLAAAGFVESNLRLFVVSSADTQCATVADSSASDVLHALKAASRARTAPGYHPRDYEFFDAAEVGRWFPISPGGDNWRMKTLSGPTPVAYTATHKTNLKAKHANYYYIFGGLNVVGGEGTVSDNEYIDVIRGIDWWSARVSSRIANLVIQSEKVPFTDAGIAKVEAEVRAQNDEGIAAGLINPSPKPLVSAPLAADVSSSDKQSRTLNNVRTSWVLAGAINHLVVNANVTA
jgi:hypothetical protein